MPDDEGMALYLAGRRAAATGLGPLLEIGTYCGKSTVYLGTAAQEAGVVVYSVDHHRGSEENQSGWDHHDPGVVDGASGRIDTLPYARRTIEAADLEGAVVLIVGESTTVAQHWAVPVALVFIDGGHGHDVAWADYRSWSPKIPVGGLLVIHDVFPDPAEGGRPPYELYCEAVESGEFDDVPEAGCGSLRVLRRLAPPRLR